MLETGLRTPGEKRDLTVRVPHDRSADQLVPMGGFRSVRNGFAVGRASAPEGLTAFPKSEPWSERCTSP